MPQNNFIHLSGNLADDPYFEMLRGQKGQTPYIRFDLVVERDPEQSGQSAQDAPDSKDGYGGQTRADERLRQDDRRADLIRVTEYGTRARIDFFYLKKGAHVCISGWLCSRRYYDRGVKRMRRIMEVNSQKVSYGRGCDFERGERQRVSILAELESQRAAIPFDLKSGGFVLHPDEILAEAG